MTELVYLVEVTAYDPDITATRVLRFASGLGLMTGPAETPANAWYDPRITRPIAFSRTLFSSARVTGGSKVGAGDIVLNNADQALAYLRDLGIDGRDVVVRVGPQGAAYPGGYTIVLTGTADQVEVGALTATIRLRDKLAVLSQPLQATLYAGTNSLPSGAEGVPDDIQGSPKPILLGRGYHVVPVLVNTAKLIYQIHDGAMHAIDAVYDKGAALTASGSDRADLAALEAATIAAGQYDTCLALGLFRLGASADGKVTADARGDATGSYVNKAGELVQRILTRFCGYSTGDLDAASFTALNAAATAECGWHFTGDTTRQQAIDIILAGCGGWLAPDRAGLWQVGQLLAPTGSPDHELTDVHILKLDSVATRDQGGGVPVWRAKLRYKPYPAFSESDIAGGVAEATRAELLRPWRETTASDTAVQTKHLLATEMTRDTPLVAAAAAATEAARVLALHKVRRDLVQAEVWITQANAAIDLDDEATLTTARLGYDSGRDFRVVGISANRIRGRLTLDLWG
jgi:hypothetical protein